MAAALDPWADVEGEGRAKPIPGGVDLARHRGFDCGAVFISPFFCPTSENINSIIEMI